MHHYVFCAAINHSANKQSIEVAKSTAKHLEYKWAVEEDVVEHHYHSSITIIEKNGNIEIKFENDNTTQLIDDCMEFARLQERYKQ